jgi:hypothetical protein
MTATPTNLGAALAAALAELDPEERMLLETIHRLRNELQAAQMQLEAVRLRRASPVRGGHGG